MNEREASVRVGVATLKRMCDPRGHSLLDALGDLAIARQEALEATRRANLARGWQDYLDTLPEQVAK